MDNKIRSAIRLKIGIAVGIVVLAAGLIAGLWGQNYGSKNNPDIKVHLFEKRKSFYGDC